jgi:hypothetical protein
LSIIALVHIWFDRSASMRFGSSLSQTSKIDRAAMLALAFADLCVRGGERAVLLGLSLGDDRRDGGGERVGPGNVSQMSRPVPVRKSGQIATIVS